MTLLEQGGWARWPLVVPYCDYHSVILWRLPSYEIKERGVDLSHFLLSHCWPPHKEAKKIQYFNRIQVHDIVVRFINKINELINNKLLN